MSGSNSSSRDAAVAEPLHLAVHSLPVAVDDDAARRTRAGRWKMLGLLAVCAAPVVASYFTYFVIRPEGRSNYATLISPAREMPALPLTERDGTPVKAATLAGQWLLVAVGGSACDAACEKRLYVQRQLREMIGRDRDRIDKLWLVTDEGPLAPPLQAAIDAAPATRVLRVPRDALARWLVPDAGRALEDHLYIVDPMGGWMMRAPADPDPVALKRDLERLLRASASWDRPGR
jgi:hypothetical protein